MTKNDIVSIIHSSTGLPKKDADHIFETFLDIIKSTLSAGNDVKITGFGKFVIHRKNERVGRNPQTNESIMISSRKIVSFKASPLLKINLNNP